MSSFLGTYELNGLTALSQRERAEGEVEMKEKGPCEMNSWR